VVTRCSLRRSQDFEVLNIELRSDTEMALSRASKGEFTGVQLAARRVPWQLNG
jgi:hypothetical protein